MLAIPNGCVAGGMFGSEEAAVSARLCEQNVAPFGPNTSTVPARKIGCERKASLGVQTKHKTLVDGAVGRVGVTELSTAITACPAD